MSKNYVVIKGVAYPIATAKETKTLSKKSTKQTENPLSKLKVFMDKQGYKVTKVEPATYTRKDGKVLECKRVGFTNKKTYLVSAKTFWKEK
jgi:hypothetical protein